ncbi:MAG: prepilin peptidase [Deltaproteobacteria bacterium]|nr:prepilin peptidase [Deltaproteobacteria bacterium]MBN2673855.1 prepilin peptidase [Deltaproteobacteria bacterium]
MNAFHIAEMSISIVVCAIGGWIDFKKGTIPNRITIVGILAGCVIGFVSHGWRGLGGAMVGVFATALVPLLLYRMNAMGGGDVKLFAAMGALLGVDMALQVMMTSFVLGACWGIQLWIREGVMVQKLKGSFRVWGVWKVKSKRMTDSYEPTYLRFGPIVLIACIIVLAAAHMKDFMQCC